MKTILKETLLTLLLLSTIVSAEQADNDSPCPMVKKDGINESTQNFESDLPIDSQDNDAPIPLLEAANEGNLATVESLLANGTNVDEKNKHGRTALIVAAYMGHLEIVKLLIANGADVDEQDKYGYTALMWAAQNNNLEIVKLLIANEAKVDEQSKYGYTALMIATLKGHSEIFKFLVSNGADINHHNGWSALDLATWVGLVEMAELCINNNADMNKQDNAIGQTPLMFVASLENSSDNRLKIAKLLLDYGCDINLQAQRRGYYSNQTNGYTALMWAAENDNLEMVELLINHNPDVDKQNKDGFTAFDLGNDTTKEIIRNFIAQKSKK